MMRLLWTLPLLALWGCDAGTKIPDESVPKESGTGACDEDGDGFCPSANDCNDADAAISPGATELCNGVDDNCDGNVDEGVLQTFYADADQDGYGSETVTIEACEAPTGYIPNNTDCDDGQASIYPGNTEVCDGLDNNCNDETDEGVSNTYYADSDGDTYGDPLASINACEIQDGYVEDATDCDDTTGTSFPGNREVCDGVDNDCNGQTDEGVTLTWYADFDGDSFGAAMLTQEACTQPVGYVADNTDCDDSMNAVYPGATEVCNGYDDDCDGDIDESTSSDGVTWYADTDGDGYGDASATVTACAQPAGYVSSSTDCNDAAAAINPAATEMCNSVDDDCDGSTDESSAADAATWYQDADGDNYGNNRISQVACAAPAGYVSDNTDCNDGSASANPAATEVCDYIDNDCDGTIDEADATNASTWYADADRDNYGDPATSTVSCWQPAGYIADNRDCDDARATSNPNAPEYCNGYDDDCDGSTDEDAALDVATWYQDLDGDAYGNAAVSDIDCDQPAGYVADDTDCLDSRYESNPGATELCNGYDDDCDGQVDENASADAITWYRDADTDGYGLNTSSVVSCAQPVGYVTDNTDCNDLVSNIYPGADEYCDGADNDCDGTVDESPVDGTTWYQDSDGDGTGNPSVTVSECSLPPGYADNGYDCNDADATEPMVADAITGTSGGNGTIGNPFLSLQDAIDNAQQCVIALPGTYREPIDLDGNSIDVWGVEGADYTIIDATMPTCTASNPTACGPAVTIASGTGAAPTLHGFTITGGSGQVSSSTSSTTCANSSASSTGLNTCTVTVYEYCGGGLYIDGDDPVISDVVLRDNTLPDFAQTSVGSFTQYWLYSYGGGACVRNSAASFDGVDVYGNFADQGGGIYASDAASLSFEQGVVFDNTATDGAGVHVSDATTSFSNAAIYCNVADTDGGGLFTETSGSTTLTNVGLVSNTSATGLTHGADAYIGTSTTLFMYNSIVENNISAYALYGSGARTFNYDNVYNATGYGYGGSITAGSNSISSGSNFVSVTCDGSAGNDNFSLRSGSASINAGDPSGAFNDTDGSRNDMGPQGGPEGGWN